MIEKERERDREKERERESERAHCCPGRSRSCSKPEKIKGKTMIKAVITDLGAVFDLAPQCGRRRRPCIV